MFVLIYDKFISKLSFRTIELVMYLERHLLIRFPLAYSQVQSVLKLKKVSSDI